ncbi:MAG: hypothetical protein AAFN17_09145, partial [Pseudomonadota bacterium]
GGGGGRIMLRMVQPVDEVVASSATGLRVYVNDPAAMPSVRRRLDRGIEAARSGTTRAAGEITLILALNEMGQEVQLGLPGHFPVGPEIRGMLKDVPGVEAVEEA